VRIENVVSPWPKPDLCGIRLGGVLDLETIVRASLKREPDESDPTVEGWSDVDMGLRVVLIDGRVALVNARSEASLDGVDIMGLPCEDVARIVDVPERFDPITGEWEYVDGHDTFSIGFSNGYVTWVTLSRS
jgi:phenylalanine-4-hydroxylase